jgi:glycine/D-amino acid oxidase-like deaminating enzyme
MPERRALTVDLDVDVCVIGGGVAALVVAGEVARRGWSVAVLGDAAAESSRMGVGLVAPGFSQSAARIAARVGTEHARVLWDLSKGGVDYVRRTLPADAASPPQGRLVVSTLDRADSCQWEADLLADTFGVEVDLWPTEQVRSTLRTTRYFQGLLHRHDFQVDETAYTATLAAAAQKAGARLFDDTSALAIDSDGVRKLVRTPLARVRASQVVLTDTESAGALCGQLHGTFTTLSRAIAVTESLGEAVRERIRFEGIVAHRESPAPLYRRDGDHLLLVSAPAAPGFGGTLPERALARFYPELKNVAVAESRTTKADYAVHGMPYIGELSRGLWLAIALGGDGLGTQAMAGDLIARAMLDADDRWRLFEPYGIVWAGGRVARIVVALGLRAASWRLALQQRFAPRGELPALEPVTTEPDDITAESGSLQGPQEPPGEPSPEVTTPEPERVEAAAKTRKRRKTVQKTVASTRAAARRTQRKAEETPAKMAASIRKRSTRPKAAKAKPRPTLPATVVKPPVAEAPPRTVKAPETSPESPPGS